MKMLDRLVDRSVEFHTLVATTSWSLLPRSSILTYCQQKLEAQQDLRVFIPFTDEQL